MGEQPPRAAPQPRWPPRAARGPPVRPPPPMRIPGLALAPATWSQHAQPPGYAAWNAPPPPRILRPPPRPPFYRGLPAFRPPPPPRLGFRGVPSHPQLPHADVAWLETFKRTYCSSQAEDTPAIEPPLRTLRRRVAEVQELVTRLQTAAAEVSAIDKRLEALTSSSTSGDDTLSLNDPEGDETHVEVSRLRVQRERKLLVCESLKRELDATNAASGLFSESKLAEIRAFAKRVQKKKAYRKRARRRRRAEASLHRAVGSQPPDATPPNSPGEQAQEIETQKPGSGPTHSQASQQLVSTQIDQLHAASPHKSAELPAPTPARKLSLDPESLTIDGLIAVRRAWDRHLVPMRTIGASTIPPHFVPPPQNPSAQWAKHIVSLSGR